MFIWRLISVLALVPAFLASALAQEPRLVVQMGHAEPVTAVGFSLDGKILGSGSSDKTVKLWDVSTGQELRTLVGHSDGVTCIAFGTDSKSVASGSSDGSLRLWNVMTGQLLRTLGGLSAPVSSIGYSPDGRVLASGTGDGVIRLWNTAVWGEPRVLRGHASPVRGLYFTADGKSLFTVSSDGEIRLWDPVTASERQRFAPQEGAGSSMYVGRDGAMLASRGNRMVIRIWNVVTSQDLFVLAGHRRPVYLTAFSPDGKSLASASEDFTVKLWTVESGKERHTLSGHRDQTSSICFSHDGKVLASGAIDGVVKLWDVASGRELQTMSGSSSSITSIRFSPDGRVLISGSDKTVKVWDVGIRQGIRTLRGHSEAVRSLCFSPDGRVVASGSVDNTIQLWDLATRQSTGSLQKHSDWVNALCFTPDGATLASAGNDETIRLWDIATARESRTLGGHRGSVYTVDVSPNGRELASGSEDRSVRLWDIATGQERKTLDGHTDRVTTVAYSPNGKELASGSEDRSVRLWDVATGQESQSLNGHSGRVNSLSYDPRGTMLASGSEDHTIILWDAKSGRPLYTFNGHGKSVTSVQFSPSGRLLASGSEDNTIRIWDVDRRASLATLIALGDSTWIVVDSLGRFDASADASRFIHWVVGTEVIGFDQLKDRYYEPGLLQKLFGFAPEPIRDVKPLSYIKLYPEVHLQVPEGQRRILGINLRIREGGFGRVPLYIDGKQQVEDIRHSPRATLFMGRKKVSVDDVRRMLAQRRRVDTVRIEVDLSDWRILASDTINQISIESYNDDSVLVRSRRYSIAYKAPRTSSSRRPHLFALVVGVSNYQGGSELDLNYADHDAAQFAKALTIGARNLFPQRFHITLLTTRDMSAYPTRANIIRSLQQIADSALHDDVVLIFFSGHGMVHGGQDGEFYFLTTEASSREQLRQFPDQLAQYTISSADLIEWIAKKIRARKFAVILDACASGRVVERFRLASKDATFAQTRIIEQMRDKTGTYILAGAAPNAETFESSQYGHGLLTYSLLKGMRGPARVEQGGIDVNTLFKYSAQTVPELAREIDHEQHPQMTGPPDVPTIYIGEITNRDLAEMPSVALKPLFLPSRFVERDRPEQDSLDIGPKLNEELRQQSQRVHAAVAFDASSNDPDGYQLTGTYTIDGTAVSVNAYLIRNKKPLGNFTVVGTTANIDGLVIEIRDMALEKLQSAHSPTTSE
jgi:WD40 repeat protein/uncharacterized caspase-like protein